MPVPERTQAVERHLLRDTAYETLRNAIVTGTLAPGETLHDGEICAWLGLSRTPVRAALARLEDDGLVESAPQRFTRVMPLTAEDAAALFPVIAALHSLAAELAVPRLEPQDVQLLRACNARHIAALETRDARVAYATDDDFHNVLVTCSANPEIVRTLARLAPRLARLELLRTGVLPGRRALAQHEAIMDRAARRDAAGTASATREHWRDVGTMVARSLTPRD
jgi:DNA-binding GntR family transcriptional regulator